MRMVLFWAILCGVAQLEMFEFYMTEHKTKTLATNKNGADNSVFCPVKAVLKKKKQEHEEYNKKPELKTALDKRRTPCLHCSMTLFGTSIFL